MALGLLLAVVVNSKIRGQTFFRASFYFPAIASSAAITLLFIFIMQPSGLFNNLRAAFGVNPIFEALGFNARFNWLGSERTALGSIMALNIWTTAGTMMLFYLASLQTIPHDVYEAAALDGASAVADVPVRHVPAAEAGPLLCGHGVRDRCAAGIRPGLYRRQLQRRSQLLDDVACPVPV